MPTCEFGSLNRAVIPDKVAMLTCTSDGDTPEKQIQQILAVTPILRGQKSNESFSIPPPRQNQQQAPPPSQTTRGESDLIDFGQNDAPAAPPRPTQDTHGGQSKSNVEQMLESTSTGQATQAPLLDFQDDMKKDLPTLLRKDTDTRSIDEFVDAEG